MKAQAQPEVAGKERTMEKLLPCPFCGETPPLKHDSGSWGYTPKSLVIECKECGVRIFEDAEAWEQGRGHFSIEKQAMEKITERWNRRAQPEVAQPEPDRARKGA